MTTKQQAKPPKDREDVYRVTKWNGWGSRDLAMRLDGADPNIVLHPTGKRIPGLVPFIHQEIEGLQSTAVSKPIAVTPSLSLEEVSRLLLPPVVNRAFDDAIRGVLSPNQVSTDGESRICHAVGKNYRDLWRARNGLFDKVPDMVLFPQSHDDVVHIVKLAAQHGVVIIPFGGGTNVVGGVEPNPFDPQNRMVVSIDMRRMNRMLSLNKESSMARFEVGILGPDIDKELQPHGFTLGHDPDSYTHSTLGGWIAARSSGAQSNKYGEIENIVVSLTVVTPTGTVVTPAVPRQVGPNLNEVFIGSEGVFGVITEVIVKVERIPPVKHYEGWLFEGFEHGFKAFREVVLTGVTVTALRLYDEDETRMSFALKTESSLVQHFVSVGVKKYLETVRGFRLDALSLCIVGYEGTKQDVALQARTVNGIFGRHRAFRVGTSAGKNWQEKKYDLPYVRDFALQHGLWADVFEAAVEHETALSLWRDTKKALKDVFVAEGRKGWIGMHTAHQYKVGCCLYFTFAGQQVDPRSDIAFLIKLKEAGMAAIIKNRGNLTHHHGVGYEHVPWMRSYNGSGGSELLLGMKKQLDPTGVCNPGKLLPLMSDDAKKDSMFYRMTGTNQGVKQSKL